jgi:hypothetical protein
MDIKKELEKVDKEINGLSKNFVNTRGRAQIANLLDKVEKRQKLPNFVSVIEIDGKPQNVDMVTFLKGIDTEVPEKEAPKLKKLEKRQIALALLLESENEE